MSDVRRKDFSEELIALVGRYNDVPAGARSLDMLIAIAAITKADNGHRLTVQEFLTCLKILIGRVGKLLDP